MVRQQPRCTAALRLEHAEGAADGDAGDEIMAGPSTAEMHDSS
jgi:hypothetical protein